MKETSVQYKAEMSEPFKGKWLISLSIGLIKEGFQATAHMVPPETPVSFLSNNMDENLFSNTDIYRKIATFEKDRCKADGSMVFMNKAHTNVGLPYYGLISEDVSDADGNINFEVSFNSSEGEVGLGALTLEFFETYPTSLTIKALASGEEVFSKTYSNDSLTFFTTDDFSDSADTLVLQIHSLNKPYSRFMCRYVLFGVGIVIPNEKFLSSTGSYKSFMHPKSIELPTQDLSLSIDNTDGTYDYDNPSSLSKLMETGQDIVLQIGYERLDGVVEYLPSESMELSSYDVDQTSLRLVAVDFLRNENEEVIFDDPTFFTEETTLYEVAQEVVKHLRNTTFTVELDDALKSVPMKFHQIVTTVKEALIQIASAARCIMEFTPQGVRIRRKDVNLNKISTGSDTGAIYSDNDFKDTNSVTNFADFQQNLVIANGNYLFPPEEKSNLKTGYVSNAVSDENGDFNEEVSFYVYSAEAIAPYYLTIEFLNATPVNLKIQTYLGDALVETLDFDEVNTKAFSTYHDFQTFDKMIVSTTKIAEPYRRLIVYHMYFDDYVYNIDPIVLDTKMPTCSIIEKTRDLYVRYAYSAPEEDGFLDIENYVIANCNLKGSSFEYDNDFVTTQEVAQDVADWLKEYYLAQMQYSIQFMGDPSLETDDIVRVPSDYSDDIIATIETNQIDFNGGGLRGKLIVRRNNNGVDNT